MAYGSPPLTVRSTATVCLVHTSLASNIVLKTDYVSYVCQLTIRSLALVSFQGLQNKAISISRKMLICYWDFHMKLKIDK